MKKTIIPILRGAIKAGLPIAVPLIEGFKNLKAEKAGEKTPHNWKSIVTQLIVWALIIYAFVSGLIPIAEAIELLK